MNSDIAIKVLNVSKRFKLYDNPITGPLKELLLFWKRQSLYKEFLAVKDVSLEIKKGEVVGIIGPNGAGKTTLLKMIAGLLSIDKGKIEINGKVTALLALGVSVQPEFTGRENIYYGGMLLGMSKKEILSKIEDIISFSELGAYIDRPFRTYSSGMKARLLFSISMSIDPDILIVDEALSTGDSYFVEKCSKRIKEICESGATIIFVSHNFGQIHEICQKVYFLSNGQIVDEGSSNDMIALYNSWYLKKEINSIKKVKKHKFNNLCASKDITIKNIKLLNSKQIETNGFYSGENIIIEILYNSNFSKSKKYYIFVGILRSCDQKYIGEINTKFYIQSDNEPIQNRKFEIYSAGKIILNFNHLLLLTGHYSLWLIIYSGNSDYSVELKDICPFYVKRKNSLANKDALFWHPCEISTHKIQ